MTDTITDSFCERCGTRYTFEKAARPRRVRLGRVRVLTRGLTTFVANDGLPMAEAMAAARNDVERAALSNQLDAFHETFNFCMTCRQYTCPSCWNEAAGECLTCAPDLSREVLPPAFPDLPMAGPSAGPDGEEATALSAAWPSADLDRGAPVQEAAGVAAAEAGDAESAEATAPVSPVADEAAAEAFDAPPAIATAPEDAAADEAPAPEVSPVAGTPVDLTAAELAEIEGALAQAHAGAMQVEPGAAAAMADAERPADDEGGVAHDADDAAAVSAAPLAAGAAVVAAASEAGPPASMDIEAAPGPAPAGPVEPGEQAAVARDQTRSLLRRFRPGRTVAATASAAAAAPAADGGTTREPDASPAPLEPERRPAPTPEPTAAASAAEAGPAAPTPEASSPVPTPVPTPVADRSRGDTIQQPTWQMVAPDTTPDEPAESPGNGVEPTPPAAWPMPGWSSQPAVQQRTPGPDASPWAARLAASRPETGGIWAASSREVLGAAAPGATPAVQACVSCGLSLSATARFCRRCGARQG